MVHPRNECARTTVPPVPQKIRNEDLLTAENQEPPAAQIYRRNWGWIGHTLRRPASNITKQALTWDSQGKTKWEGGGG